MMLHVPKVLTSEQVAECRRLLDTAEWMDGKATVGEQGALVKRNRQLPELSPVGRQLGELILTALSRSPLFFSAALPLKTVPPPPNQTNMRTAPDYWVVDAMLGYTINEKIQLQLNAYNLTDEVYAATLNNSGARYSPGTPRSALLTVNFTF